MLSPRSFLLRSTAEIKVLLDLQHHTVGEDESSDLLPSCYTHFVCLLANKKSLLFSSLPSSFPT